MPWLISFIVSWIVFFILVDSKKLKTTIIAGIFTMVLQLYVDHDAIIYGLYSITNPIINLLESSLFFTFGIAFTLGVLFVQYLPKTNKWLKILNILVWALLFLILEVFMVNVGVIKHIKWSYLNSFSVNIAIFIILTWMGETFFTQTEKKGC